MLYSKEFQLHSFCFWLCFLFLLPISNSQPNNFYLELKKNTLEVGQYCGKNFKKKPLKEYPYRSQNIEEIKKLLLEDGEENVLYYFHCLYGGVRVFHKNSLKKLNQGNKSHKIITIVWHSSNMGYKKDWELTIRQGLPIQQLLLELWAVPAKNNSILCHSMGHRIFSGVVKDVDNPLIRFEKVIFAGSDLEVDVFANNLKNLPAISEKIVIYIHRKDWLLKISAKKHRRKRLGRHGLETNDFLAEIDNLERIDVTDSAGKKFIQTTNHSYFKQDNQVLVDVRALLENDLEQRLNWLEKVEKNVWKMK